MSRKRKLKNASILQTPAHKRAKISEESDSKSKEESLSRLISKQNQMQAISELESMIKAAASSNHRPSIAQIVQKCDKAIGYDTEIKPNDTVIKCSKCNEDTTERNIVGCVECGTEIGCKRDCYDYGMCCEECEDFTCYDCDGIGTCDDCGGEYCESCAYFIMKPGNGKQYLCHSCHDKKSAKKK
eukprot:779927_1